MVGFASGRGQLPTNVTLGEADLAPLVDFSATTPSTLDPIPRGAFKGAGARFPANMTYVLWEERFLVQRDCSTLRPTVFNGSFTLPLPDAKHHPTGATSHFNLVSGFRGGHRFGG